MSLQYRKRVRLGNGLGLNISSKGVSTSYRSKYGTVGSRGFSIKTGISGLSLRTNWGKGANGLIVLMVTGICYVVVILLYNLFRLLRYLGESAISKISDKQIAKIK